MSAATMGEGAEVSAAGTGEDMEQLFSYLSRLRPRHIMLKMTSTSTVTLHNVNVNVMSRSHLLDSNVVYLQALPYSQVCDRYHSTGICELYIKGIR